MAKIEEIVVKKSRQGEPICHINGRTCFPDRKHKIPDGVQIGDFWEVEITGENPKRTVYFFRFLKKTRTEIMTVFVYNGNWGTEWRWDYDDPHPQVTIPYHWGQPACVEDGVWKAEVCGYRFVLPTVIFLEKLFDAEQMLLEQEILERIKNGGFLKYEVMKTWEKANNQVRPRYKDSKDAIYYLRLVENSNISSLEVLLGIMISDLKEMQIRHEYVPVVFPSEATSKYSMWWNYIEKKKVWPDGTHREYVIHVKSLEIAVKEDIENFLRSMGKDPDGYFIEEGYYDQDDGTSGHFWSD